MKNVLSLIFTFLIYLNLSAQFTKPPIKYFNVDKVEISKSEFNKLLFSARFLGIQGDSVHHRKLVIREERGNIDRPELESILEKSIGFEIDSSKPIIIIYYPGIDLCNASGSATPKQVEQWYKKLEKGINKIVKTKPIYVYKNNEGLEKEPKSITWHKDPGAKVEKTFFKHHYPCGSFTVISKNGDYYSYFAEYPKEFVWKATKELK